MKHHPVNKMFNGHPLKPLIDSTMAPTKTLPVTI